MNESVTEYRSDRSAYSVALDGETLIWHAETQQLHRLNATATHVWTRLSDWTTVASLADTLQDPSGANGMIASDVAACIEQLSMLSLVEARVAASYSSGGGVSSHDAS